MKRIVLPTDFSENSYNAIDYALNLFKEEECSFYLLHVFSPSIYYEEREFYDDRKMPLDDTNQIDSLRQLNGLHERILKKFENPKHIFVPHSTLGFLVDEIRALIKKEKIDLVVMGTKGATGAKEVLLGTNTVDVIKKVERPVIAVPSTYPFSAPKNILFPTDYEIDYQKTQLSELLNIAQRYTSAVHILHIGASSGLNGQQLTNKAKLQQIANGNSLFYELPNDDTIEGIYTFQAKNPMDFLIMIQNKHTFLERLFVKSIVRKIGFAITIPFMVIPHWSRKGDA
ncbi:universal stress protein [Ulvibacterium sp.]|uniref:universal stress protein n=1 Tax=Ulvibacterium sp. TaxID=2665914 RepID=UPI003BA9846D